MPDLPAPDRARLAKLCGMLASNFDGERAAAGKLVSDFLARHGVTWAELLLQPASAAQGRARPQAGGYAAQSWRLNLAVCTRHFGRLTGWEQQLCTSLRSQRRDPSPKQAAILAGIADSLRLAGFA